ncbi:hypothetical protein scyTo_0020871 [Scyliorhinus torazame]|uniref:Uncharacterized protein n=1 Tax=Scyliorhinus torazame TaxID=75743 RepID=A0A401PPF3_SCYTO|nr:hypothetical protein [Scyliorhinus torazame]
MCCDQQRGLVTAYLLPMRGEEFASFRKQRGNAERRVTAFPASEREERERERGEKEREQELRQVICKCFPWRLKGTDFRFSHRIRIKGGVREGGNERGRERERVVAKEPSSRRGMREGARQHRESLAK